MNRPKLLLILMLSVSLGVAQDKSAPISAERIMAACAKVRARYTPCYPTLANLQPKPCAREMDLMQKMLPVMEEVATIASAHQAGRLFFNTESTRDFVETVEAWR